MDNKTARFYQSQSGSMLKLHLATQILSVDEASDIITKLKSVSSDSMIEQLVMIRYGKDLFKLKKISHSANNEVVRCFKQSIHSKNVDLYSAQIIHQTEMQCITAEPSMVSIIHKMLFMILPNWAISISLIRDITNPLEFSTRLREYKDALLKETTIAKPILGISTNAYDKVSFDLEFMGDVAERNDVAEAAKLASDLVLPKKADNFYQDTIYAFAREIFRDHRLVEKFKNKSGFKQLSPSAIELSRTIYFKEVLPIIDQFYITDKIDGARTMIQIVEYFRRNGQRRTLLGAEIISLNNEAQILQAYSPPKTKASNIEAQKTILDTELLMEDDHKVFNAFDIVMIKNKKVSNLPFKMRYKEFDSADKLLKKYNLGGVKSFVRLTKDSYKDQLEQFYNSAKDKSYEIDGIIFTPAGTYFKDLPKQDSYKPVFNTEFYNTISYKWKPVEQSTIDFYLMHIPQDALKRLRKEAGMNSNQGAHWYALCSGVNDLTFKKLNMQFFDGYQAPESENAHQYFPIQFSPYDDPYMFLWSSDDASLTGKVAEFKFIGKDQKMLDKPQLVRIRDDRTNDIRKGEYFGNALRYAELIWHSIKHPLTFDMLGLSSKDLGGYFAVSSEQDYFAQRAFNSFVKGEIIKEYLNPPSLIDIMCGKGQDMARAIELGFTNILMMDRDIDAIYELLQRKYNLRLKTKDASANIHIRQVDLEDSYEDIIMKNKLPTNATAAMLNFGIHYIAHDKTEHNTNLPMDDLFKLLSYMLAPKARFMATCFDGKHIFDLLKDNDQWDTADKKYSIKKAYTSDQFASLNQAIDVQLPFSGGAYYREYLVNIQFLESIAQEHGFKLIESASFGEKLRSFKKHNAKIFAQMSDSDKEWGSLYSFIVFEKQ